MVRAIHDELSRARSVRTVVLALRGAASYHVFEAALVAASATHATGRPARAGGAA
jgi:hypothetical protein